ncbi:MAG: patatin family protein [Fibrobacter sp.]|uniref:patatin-like phospholipase family protein n=1 Tax=Fibrobacter sp. TaxID=35828 RepID=UPI0025C3542C|nr:patatin family protein [Fibrobacter sp.]MBR4785284.1 patatin family protein [Fibrobacter sp.]
MKTGLVLEGGSRQTMFSAGVLDTWLDEGIEFNYVSGVSAGAHAAVNFVTRQQGRLKFIVLPTRLQEGKKWASKFIGIQKEFHALNYLSADGKMPFDFDTYSKSKIECEFGLTCCETGRAEFKSEKNDKWRLLDIISASCALPMLFPMAPLDGKHYADGCITVPIPFERAFERGCDKVVAVSTHYPGEAVTDFRKYRAILNPMYKRKYPELFRALMLRLKRYDKMFLQMDKLEKEGRLFLMRPEIDLCDQFDTDMAKMNESYDHGVEIAKRRMDDLKAFLEL